jgi:membrane protein YdbS with pleckstrin-like domain
MNNSGFVDDAYYPVEKIWIIKSSIASIFVLPFFIIYFIFINKAVGILGALFLGSFYIIFFCLGVTLHILWNSLRRSNFHYILEDQFMDVSQGIISKSTRKFPYSSIQTINADQGIMDKIFGLKNVTIENAAQTGSDSYSQMFQYSYLSHYRDFIGYQGNVIRIPGLSEKNADSLKGILMKKIQTNPIQDLGM